MVESLGARLLIWHTAIVAVVIAVFGGTICYLVWRARLVDVDAALAARATVLSEALRPADRETFDLTLAPSLVSDDRLYHSLWTKNGAVIDRSDDEQIIPVPATTGARTRAGSRELVTRTPSGAVVLVGRDLADLRAELWALAALLLATGAAVLALSIAAGWLLTGRALAPIYRINSTARQMIDGDLSARIPIEHVETELGQVARAINEAFDRLQASLDRQRRLSADVSHELRTPLATLSTEVQWALGRDRAIAEYRDSLEVCRRAAGRMQVIVERLLSLARAESAAVRDVSVAIALDDLVRHALADLTPLAAGRHVHVRADLAPATVMGDPDRLREAITHVVTNAISYNVADGSVTIGLEPAEQSVALVVTDTGVGISASDLPHIFDPFFRADQARSRDAGGRTQAGMAAVRRALKTPLATNMCTTSFDDLPGSVRLGSEDIILTDHHFWGGLRASMELAAHCRTFSRGVSMHSNNHAGISLAAMTHLGAAMPNLSYALDTHYPWQWEEIVTGGRLKFEGGCVTLPKGPGLGVELDRPALARAHATYRRVGLTERNDEIEMQKKVPGWKFAPTRW